MHFEKAIWTIVFSQSGNAQIKDHNTRQSLFAMLRKQASKPSKIDLAWNQRKRNPVPE
jgi:surface antigen